MKKLTPNLDSGFGGKKIVTFSTKQERDGGFSPAGDIPMNIFVPDYTVLAIALLIFGYHALKELSSSHDVSDARVTKNCNDRVKTLNKR